MEGEGMTRHVPVRCFNVSEVLETQLKKKTKKIGIRTGFSV
jgi:hypothetical protein